MTGQVFAYLGLNIRVLNRTSSDKDFLNSFFKSGDSDTFHSIVAFFFCELHILESTS